MPDHGGYGACHYEDQRYFVDPACWAVEDCVFLCTDPLCVSGCIATATTEIAHDLFLDLSLLLPRMQRRVRRGGRAGGMLGSVLTERPAVAPSRGHAGSEPSRLAPAATLLSGPWYASKRRS
jgi:hypothetical protein